MSRNSRWWVLAILGALVVGATLFLKDDDSPGPRAGKDTAYSGYSGAPPTDDRTDDRQAYSPPPDVGREAMKSLSSALLGGSLTEPPPGFQAVQAQPPSPLIAAAKQGLETEKRSTRASASRAEPAIETPRADAERSPLELAIETPPVGAGGYPPERAAESPKKAVGASLPELAIEAPPESAATPSFASVSRGDEDASYDPVSPEYDGSDAELARLSVPSSEPSPESRASAADFADHAEDNMGSSGANSLETSGLQTGPTRSDDEARAPPIGEERAPMDEQFQVRSSAHEGESRDLLSSEPEAASNVVDFNAGTAAEEDPETVGLSKRREAPPSASAPVIAPNTAMHLERLLYRLGFNPGPIDGVIEPMTVEAVMLFQEEDGRETTGEIDYQLIASLEDRLFESFRRHRESLDRQSSAPPERTPAITPTSRPETAPPAKEQARQGVAAYGARQPVAEKRTRPSTSDARPLERPAQEPATRIEPPRANPSQQVRLEARGKETGDSEPNPFEACARSGQQGEYVKTQSGFVLCEEFSFDAGIRR